MKLTSELLPSFLSFFFFPLRTDDEERRLSFEETMIVSWSLLGEFTDIYISVGEKGREDELGRRIGGKAVRAGVRGGFSFFRGNGKEGR